jgi:RND family efflux transporter MFP subunit
VDQAEQAFNAAADQVDLLDEQIALFPIRIRESRAALASARAALDTAAANLDRCTIRAPFRGRIRAAAVEAGQYVTPGGELLSLADDSVLEIEVPIDSRDARKWLRFDETAARSGDGAAWFSGLTRVPCTIQWTEESGGPPWTGHLHRVVRFEPETRTLTVAVRVTAAEARGAGAFPLVEGMFCAVAVPGRMLEGVVRLPRWAVTFRETVYLAEGSRLKTAPVTVAWTDGEEAFVSEGIPEGQKVIVTRLSDPLENALLEIIPRTATEDRS